MARDYKHRGRGRSQRRSEAPGWVWMLFGLALGLSISLFVYFGERADRRDPRPRAGEPASARAEVAEIEGTGEEAGARQYDFYDMLPTDEVVVPTRPAEARRAGRAAQIERPGLYVLQAGSFRNANDAERMRATLALQAVSSQIQKVTIDTDTFHRVRIGPIDNVAEVNRIRQRLLAEGIDVLTIRLSDP